MRAGVALREQKPAYVSMHEWARRGARQAGWYRRNFDFLSQQKRWDRIFLLAGGYSHEALYQTMAALGRTVFRKTMTLTTRLTRL